MGSLKWVVAAAVAVALLVVLGAKVTLADEGGTKCEGTVKAVDAAAKKLTCTKSCGMEVECTVVDDAKVTINGKEAKLDEVKAGDKVECMTEKKGDATVAKSIAVKRD